MDSHSNKVSEAVIRRLPRYYRYISELLSNDVKRISSNELSKKMGITASQIRQDFNNFGGFGQQGYGYNVRELYNEISKIIGLDRDYNVAIFGVGNLGQAIANYTNFENRGFKLKALFDVNPRLIGLAIRGIEVLDLDKFDEEFVKKHDLHIAVICTPRSKSQEAVERSIKCGIKGIWNFAPVDLKVPDDVIVEHVHLSDSLFTLSYRMSYKQNNDYKTELFPNKI